MGEKEYKAVSVSGAISLTAGIIVITVGIITGVLAIVSGARMLSLRKNITF